jgi:hypothetical protein
LITVKNSFIDFGSNPVANGLVLRLNNIVAEDSMGTIRPFTSACTTQTYKVSDTFKHRLEEKSLSQLSTEGERKYATGLTTPVLHDGPPGPSGPSSGRTVYHSLAL